MYFCLKNRESGLLNTFGPSLRPMRYPVWVPA